MDAKRMVQIDNVIVLLHQLLLKLHNLSTPKFELLLALNQLFLRHFKIQPFEFDQARATTPGRIA
jgi:hypothetical protein